jgi:hypothetical protein
MYSLYTINCQLNTLFELFQYLVIMHSKHCYNKIKYPLHMLRLQTQKLKMDFL